MACYMIAHGVVHDPDGFAAYAARSPGTIEAHGGEYIVRGGHYTVTEGETPDDRYVVIRFPDRATAEGWYNSPEYREIRTIRQATADVVFMFVDGIEP